MKRNQRRGYTLIEVMAALLIYAAFAAVAMELLYSSVGLMAKSQAADAATARFDGMVEQLRTDCRTAKSVTNQPGGVTIGDVRWTADAGAVTRAAGRSSRSWVVEQKIAVSTAGPLVLLTPGTRPAVAIAWGTP